MDLSTATNVGTSASKASGEGKRLSSQEGCLYDDGEGGISELHHKVSLPHTYFIRRRGNHSSHSPYTASIYTVNNYGYGNCFNGNMGGVVRVSTKSSAIKSGSD
jgi:hypothetical protein